MPSVRTVVRTLTAAFLIAAPLFAAPAVPASAQTGNPAGLSRTTARTDRAAPHSLAVAIDSVSPNWAQPGKRITVHGTVTNNTGSPVSGLQVAMQTSQGAFGSPSQMDSYVQGSTGSSADFATTQVGSPFTVPGVFHTGTTRSWSVSFPASDAGYSGFGVYPLEAVVYNSSLTPLAAERTLLPYWPGNSAAYPVKASWIWPLVDQPQQGPCPQTLDSNDLAASLEPTGRLGGLLNAGLEWSGQADLTWAVDPALLSNARTMTSGYKTGGDGGCDGATSQPASPAAQNWLNTLKTGAAGQPMFVTPYADADTTALAHAGLLNNMKSAYTLGDQLAGQILARPSLQAAAGTGDGGAPSAAWLPGGPTDKGVLSALQETGKISTAVVGSADEPSFPSTTPVSTPTRSGTPVKVLTADSGLSDILGTATLNASPGAQFATEQDFVAQTAMIVAQYPFTPGRSIVIAPPRRWSPSGAEASALLKDSVQAPWLRPAKLSGVASSKATPEPLPRYQFNDEQLTSSYMGDVKAAGTSLRNYQSLLYQPSTAVTQSLEEALTGAASSAWRGSKAGAGTADLIGLLNFGPANQNKVKIIAGSKFLLTGASGDIPVSVQNGTSQAIQVRVRYKIPDVGQLSVGTFNALLTVSPGKTGTVKIPVHATSIETTTLRLQLVTQNGTSLPGTQQPVTLQATRYGQVLIYLIVAALGVVVLASGTRWVRRRRKGTMAGSGGTG